MSGFLPTVGPICHNEQVAPLSLQEPRAHAAGASVMYSTVRGSFGGDRVDPGPLTVRLGPGFDRLAKE